MSLAPVPSWTVDAAPEKATGPSETLPARYFPNLAAIDHFGNLRLDRRREESFPVSLTILYRHPRRPDEAGMTVVADQAKAAAMKTQLEHSGYLVIKIVSATFAKTVP